MSKSHILWTDKHKPSHLSEVVGQQEGIAAIVKFILVWMRGYPERRGLLLTGGSGIGKTLCVELVAKMYDYELIELNASDSRTAEHMQYVVGVAARARAGFGKKGKIVFLDEVDGIHGQADKGGLSTLCDIIEVARNPMILTANDVSDPKFERLRKICYVVQFNNLTPFEIEGRLRQICIDENVNPPDEILLKIGTITEGDMRAAINMLQGYMNGEDIDLEIKKLETERELDFWSYTTVMLNAPSEAFARATIEECGLPMLFVFSMISENLWRSIDDRKELMKAYNALSEADIMIKSQGYSKILNPYIESLIAVAVMVRHDRSKYKHASFPRRISGGRVAKDIREGSGIIAKHCHVSTKYVLNRILPLLKYILVENPVMASNMVKDLGFETTADAIALLRR